MYPWEYIFRSDDLEYHAARVAQYYLALKQGQWPVYWAPNVFYGFGYPVFLFSYQLPYMVAAFWYAAGLSIEASMNATLFVFVALGFLGSGMVAWLKQKDWLLAVATSLLWTSATYPLLNLMVRGALGEVAFWGVFPWVLVWILVRRQAQKWWVFLLGTMAIVCFLLTHPMLVVFSLPVVLMWWLLLGGIQELRSWHQNVTWLLPWAVSWISAGCLSLFFWLPLVFEKHWTQVADSPISQGFADHFLSLQDLVWRPWGYGGLSLAPHLQSFPTTLGAGVVAVIVVGVAWLLLAKNQKKNEVWFWLGVFVVSCWLATGWSQIVWEQFSFLPLVQFPWRFLSVATLAGIMMLVAAVPHFWPRVRLVFLMGIIGISLFQLAFWARPAGWIRNDDITWREFVKSTTTIDELTARWFDLHKNLRLEEKIALRNSDGRYFLDSGRADMAAGEVRILDWNGTSQRYEVIAETPVDVLQKTMYFPGWEATVDGQSATIRYEDEEFPGRVIIPVSAGKHEIEVRFTNNTPARKFGTGFFLFGFVTICITVLKMAYNNRNIFINESVA